MENRKRPNKLNCMHTHTHSVITCAYWTTQKITAKWAYGKNAYKSNRDTPEIYMHSATAVQPLARLHSLQSLVYFLCFFCLFCFLFLCFCLPALFAPVWSVRPVAAQQHQHQFGLLDWLFQLAATTAANWWMNFVCAEARAQPARFKNF